MILTSLDEENGIVKSDLKIFIERRFTTEALETVDKVFCWGQHDYSSLKKYFPRYKKKFCLTGAPRADMWKNYFSEYWKKKLNKDQKKKYILISCNFSLINGFENFSKIVKKEKQAGYYKRSKDSRKEDIEFFKVSKKNFDIFKDTINFLSNELPHQTILVRPHPKERVSTWKKIFKNCKNIKVSNDQNFNYDLSNSKVLIHNSSTTAFQAALSGVPVISFIPEKNNFSSHGEMANKLGKMIESKEKLLLELKKICSEKKLNKKDYINKKILSYKIYNNPRKFSSQSIHSIWRKLFKNNFKKNNWSKIRLYLRSFEYKSRLKKSVSNFIFLRKNKNKNINYKFENFNLKQIQQKIFNLKKVLKLKCKFNVNIVSDKTLLISKK